MATSNATLVNVALHTIGQEFRSPISTIQWVMTGYMLAFASAIPIIGWASERFGIKRVWIGGLLLFVAFSTLSGLAWSAEALIVFRVLQGIAGGILLPVGQAIIAQTAGPERMGRVISIVGVPLLLGAVIAPAVGGIILSSLGWQWIFFVNLPLGLVAVTTALWLLPKDTPQPAARPDLRGLILLSSGVAIIIYATSLAATAEDFGGWRTAVGLGIGPALLVAYVVHARIRADRALIDIALLRVRAFAAAAAINFVIAIARSGGLFLLPLYWQMVHGESPLATGLLLGPMAAGAALAMPLAGWAADRIGAVSAVPVGIGCVLLGAGAYTQVESHVSSAVYAGALFVFGFGTTAVIVPSFAVAYATLSHQAVPRGASALLTVQRLGDALGTALLAVVLQVAITAGAPQLDGPAQQALDPGQRSQFAPVLAHAFGQAFWVVFVLAVITLIPAMLLPGRRSAGAERPGA